MSGFQQCRIDDATLQAARRGERQAQESIYRQYSTAVFTLALRILQHREAAEEVLQDTFVEVLRKVDSFRGEAPFGAWVRRIAVNKALGHLRSAWHRYSRPLDAIAEPACYDEAQSGDELAAALSRLRPTARAVVWLHDVEGYTHKEIAALMGKTPSFSKSQLSRAHQRLRELLQPQRDDMTCMQALNNC